MKIKYRLKQVCVLLLVALLGTSQMVTGTIAFATDGLPSVTIDESTLKGPRLAAKTSNMGNVSYQWQIAESKDGEWTDIENAEEQYYDITAEDAGKFIRVKVGEYVSEATDAIGQLVVFDLAQGSVTLKATYSGKNASGESISGTHVASNIYVVQQGDVSKDASDKEMTKNSIYFAGHFPNVPFDVTLDGVHMGENPTNHNQAAGSGGVNTPDEGFISIPASSEVKNVTIRLKKENIVRYIMYYNGGDTQTPANVKSSLKFTDINGDGATDGGSLYMPVKLTAEEIEAFVKTKTNYNHWNAGIGGTDGSSLVQNLTIAGGNLQVVTTLGDNCTAIGAGGNGYCQMEISGGNVVAHCNGTGAAIGGGIGWQAKGGPSNVLISGGTVYAKNHSEIYSDGEVVGGVAIGSGSSFHASGSEGKVTITGGTVEAYGTFGNGIGGGNSSTSQGGDATISITGGTINASSIGGGNSKKGVGGTASVTVKSPANVTLTGGIGGGDSDSGTGGEAEIAVDGGTMNIGGVIGGGTGGISGDGGTATVTVNGGLLTSAAIGGGTGGISGDGGAAEIYIHGGNIITGSIGGGTTQNPDGHLGYAKVKITGGDIVGQFLMFAPDDSQKCTFEMTGGRLHGVDTTDTTKNYAMADGAAVYMDDPNGEVTLTGGIIEDCKAENGGAVYMTAGTFDISDNAKIENCISTKNGGAVYLGGGEMNVSGGTITNCKAQNGGAAYVLDGDVEVKGGEITGNIAYENGGGIAVADGNFTMYGGHVTKNKSDEGNGGGIYVSSATENANVAILSGNVSNNTSLKNGGALAVVGSADGTNKIDVIIGVKKLHFDATGNPVECNHSPKSEFESTDCPVIKDNHAENSGGAIYVTGNEQTKLNIYCLEESGSTSGGDKKLSDFMKVEGGAVIISTSEEDNLENKNSTYGNVQIESTMYYTGGKIEIWGDMTNPKIGEIITVDIEKEEDYFIDNREVKNYYKLIYYENFTDPVTNITTGQYKEEAIEMGKSESIKGNIYNHPGYTIVGWNTDPEGKHNYKQGTYDDATGWYSVGEPYMFDGNPIGDLTIYAIWKANGYTIVYNPNIPSSETFTGSMPDKTIYYDIPTKLDANQYGRPGYEFVGWSKNASGPVHFEDKEEVLNLSANQGEVIPLYAQWKVCDHNMETHTYTYSVIDDGHTLKRACSCTAYQETATIHAESTIYNKQEHPATVTYSSKNWQPDLTYTKDGESFEDIPLNAGIYTASVSAGGKTAVVEYEIEKANQPHPGIPVYVSDINETKSIFKVNPVEKSPIAATDPTYNSKTQYKVVYYLDNVEYTTEWKDEAVLEGGYAAIFELPGNIADYYICVKYTEGLNYKESPTTTTDSTHMFLDNVKLIVNCGKGITYSPKVAGVQGVTEDGIELSIELSDGFYFPNEYTLTISTENDGGNQATITEISKYSKYKIDNISKNSVITVTIPDATPIPNIKGTIVEKERFGTVTSTSAAISRDSAFTASFEVYDYNINDYTGLKLSFSTQIPKGTSLILLDKQNKKYYWMETGESLSDINLKNFSLMGAETVKFTPYNGDMSLQIIVNFARVQGGAPGESIDTTLLAEKVINTNAITVSADLSSQLKDISTFSCNLKSNGVLTKITYKQNVSEGIISKWEYRNTAIVLTPKDMDSFPKDAYLSYSNGDATTNLYRSSNGNFIIPITEMPSGTLEVTLISKLFPKTETTYEFDAKWIASNSVAAQAPANGDTLVGSIFDFNAKREEVASLDVTSDKKLYNLNETMNVTVTWENVPLNYETTATLLVKNDSGEYTSTAWNKAIDTTNGNACEFTVPLAGQKDGSYCLQVTYDLGSINITKVNYYFIIKK